jgi:cell division protein FtsN
MNNLIRNIILIVLLIAVIAGAFYISFKVSERMLTPMKKLPAHYLITAEAAARPPLPATFEARPVKMEHRAVKRMAAARPYVVQLGVFAKVSNAKNLYADLKDQHFNVKMSRTGRLYRVYCGSFKTKEEAEAYRQKLIKAGYQEAIVRRDF